MILNCTKKLIKAKLRRVLIEYKLFDFYTDDDGIEMIGLQRVKDDIDAMNKSKQDGAKGGLKRAENVRNRTKPMEVSPEIKKNYITIDNMIRTIPDGFYTTTKEKQLGYIDNLRQKNEPIEFINFVIQSSKK